MADGHQGTSVPEYYQGEAAIENPGVQTYKNEVSGIMHQASSIKRN
jgi:hypothetical protein